LAPGWTSRRRNKLSVSYLRIRTNGQPLLGEDEIAARKIVIRL
jgi:hypothetical protein